MIIFVITTATNKLENDMLSKGFQFSRNYSDFIFMELLVGQYLRFLHTVKAWNFRFVLYFPTRNLTFYGSHTVKIKWLIYNSSIYRQFTGVGFVNYTSLNFRKSKQLRHASGVS